jgi:hypothetical protein
MIITHTENGEFKVTMDDGRVVDAGPNMRGMIRYTYFEDTEDYPPPGWSITQQQLMETYFPKVLEDMKLNPEKFEGL